MKVGTWNVQTMMDLGKLQLLVQELDSLGMNVTGLCGVRWNGEGRFNVGEHTVVYSGNTNGGSNGVAIILDKSYAAALKSFNAINDRILVVKLNTKKGILNIIQVYAPTSACSLEEIEEFYNNLQMQKIRHQKGSFVL
ncbi:craniofacial development protein 2-like [Elysia marginata]|uniref:Craniofacial development protein 2-like n=1 Tax=Elysia marginata TaxID=1093978 RepID=A0AAV4GXK4_9GAST|nr:craniofacial development protein 2-like [Elysia marginata]